MHDEAQFVLDHCKEKMELAIRHLEKELLHIRAGKSNPAMVDAVTVDYYGSQVPLAQVSNISTPDPRTIAIQPWDKKMIQAIERAIINSNLGFNPDNNGEIIRINVPVPTEERRRSLVMLYSGHYLSDWLMEHRHVANHDRHYNTSPHDLLILYIIFLALLRN